ncbi:MAG TPA: 3-oxoadipate enol-lactonase [Xanthobacteraceae bacterium]|nr:3-oxoadipate enol-lactonase [Xanthobacteraceae bacterium]
MHTSANGITFHCQIDGPENAPWLVFSNSLATNLHMWDDQAAALKTSFRILRYDQRGHGGTEATDGRYNFDLLVADVIGLFDALSIKRAHFCGISMGGMTGLALAQRHPERLDKLVACDCGPASSPASAQQWEERIDIAERQGMEPLVEATARRWFPPEFIEANPAVFRRACEMIRNTPVRGFIGCAGALANFDLRPGLSGIKAPTLLIVGSKDATIPGMKAINAAIPGSKLVELAGAGHLSNMEKPQQFTAALQQFLAGT